MVQGEGRGDVGLSGEGHQPHPVAAAPLHEGPEPVAAASSRSTFRPPGTKSIAAMLPERSTAATMSMPLARIEVRPSPVRGRARAAMQRARHIQRSEGAERIRRRRPRSVISRTSSTEE